MRLDIDDDIFSPQAICNTTLVDVDEFGESLLVLHTSLLCGAYCCVKMLRMDKWKYLGFLCKEFQMQST